MSEPKIFRALKVSNICQQMLQNNSEHCNSACQLFNLTTILRSQETFTHQKCELNDWQRRLHFSAGSDHSLLKIRLRNERMFDRKSEKFSVVLFTNITILKSEYFVCSAFFGSPSLIAEYYVGFRFLMTMLCQ